MNLSQQLKTLAKGINPESGECLDADSIVNNIDTVRLLFVLAEELEALDKPAKRKSKLTPEITTRLREKRPINSSNSERNSGAKTNTKNICFTP